MSSKSSIFSKSVSIQSRLKTSKFSFLSAINNYYAVILNVTK